MAISAAIAAIAVAFTRLVIGGNTENTENGYIYDKRGITLPSRIPMPQVAARRAVKWNSGSPNSRDRELIAFRLKFPFLKLPSRVISGIPEVF